MSGGWLEDGEVDGAGNANWDVIATHNDGIWKVHGPLTCAGGACAIHNPSEHHMRDWPLGFLKLGVSGMVGAQLAGYALVVGTRTCGHEVPHLDPDSLAHTVEAMGIGAATVMVAWERRSCDGCCRADGASGMDVGSGNGNGSGSGNWSSGGGKLW